MTVVDGPAPMGQPSSELATVLAVDDEPSVLSALTRLLVRSGVRVLTATSGPEALRLLDEQAPSISVLISDYTMPGMNGAELLHTVRLRWPTITRVLLTGNADMPSAARAVNEGQLSRLYTKPWQPHELQQAVIEALGQHRILTENRRLWALADEQAQRLEQLNRDLEQLVVERTSELEQANLELQRGLLEIVGVLLISLDHRFPRRAARCKEVARLAGRLAERAGVGVEEVRRVQVAALVHDVGLTALPDAILRRPPAELSMSARTQYQGHAAVGQRMLSSVAELSDIATWIRHHHERWDGRGYPDRLAGDAIPLPSRIIALADGYLEAVDLETGTAARWRGTQKLAGEFDPQLVNVLDDELRGHSVSTSAPRVVAAHAGFALVESAAVTPDDGVQAITVAIETLRTGMVLVEELQTTSGTVLLRAGERLTAERLQRIQEFLREGILLTRTVSVVAGTLVTGSAPPIVHANQVGLLPDT